MQNKIVNRQTKVSRGGNEMTPEEMQRILNAEAERGSSELEAFRYLANALGIQFPDVPQDSGSEKRD